MSKPTSTQTPVEPPFAGDLGANAAPENPAGWARRVQESGADLTLPPAPMDGSRAAGLAQLDRTVQVVLPEYHTQA